jgi:dipeptidyl aminopeptidase/acylaminoacyl peptidase
MNTARIPLSLLLGASALIAPTAVAQSPAPRPASPTALPIEAIMQAPFVLELSAAPARGAVAFVLKEQGKRNIYLAEPPAYTPKKVTSYDQDDGIEITDLSWSEDARVLLFVRGGDSNRRGERPNPTSNPVAARQQVHLINLETGDVRLVGEGHGPQFSIAGDQILYVSAAGELFAAPAAGGDAKSILKTRGGISQVTLSPDGRRLAFTNRRGDHGFVGVYDFQTQTVTHPDPSVDTDSNPVFSPDGARLAFLREAADSLSLPFAPVRETEPWSIHTFDFRTGAAREAFRADRGRGSAFSGLASPRQILWSRDDLLVFPWEKTGWKNLYAIPSAGGAAPTNLIPGEHEIEYAVLSADGRDVLAVTNAGDINRRRVMRVGAQGKAAASMISDAGVIDWAGQSTSDGGLAFVRADARMPGRVFVKNAAGDVKNVSGSRVPATFPAERLVIPEAVTFFATDGMRISGQLFLPPGLKAGEKRPAVLFTHGGSRRQMLLGWHYMEYYHGTYAMNEHLASLGYVVLSINYRSGIGYGLDFREAMNYGATGASEFGDVLGAGLYLRSRADVDPARIGLWGGSYGGYLTALGLARASDLFKAGVDIHGVHDWNVVVGNFADTYDPQKREAFAKLAFASSPMSSLDTWRSPVLVIHGDDDRNVPFSETVDLVQELRKRKVEVEQLIFPDEVHDLLRHESWVKAFERTAEYFGRKLR